MLYDFTYRWNLKKERKNQTHINRNRLIDTQNELVIAKRKEGG